MKDNLINKNGITAYKSSFSGGNKRALAGGGAIIKFLATSEDTNGLYAMFEAKGIPGMEPPPHTHTLEDETYYILEGTIWFKVGDKEITANKGDFVFLPRLVRHEFKVLSTHFHCQVGVFPAGIDGFFMEVSMPYDSDEIPPVVSDPPSPEVLDQMMQLNLKYGIAP